MQTIWMSQWENSLCDRFWHGVLSQLCELLAEKPLLAASVLGHNSTRRAQ
jgi:hypothetical protein